MIYDVLPLRDELRPLHDDARVLQPALYRTDAYGEITAARRALDAARERELQGVDTRRAVADSTNTESVRLAHEIQKMKSSHKGEFA